MLFLEGVVKKLKVPGFTSFAAIAVVVRRFLFLESGARNRNSDTPGARAGEVMAWCGQLGGHCWLPGLMRADAARLQAGRGPGLPDLPIFQTMTGKSGLFMRNGGNKSKLKILMQAS